MSNQDQSWGILPTQQDEDNTRAHAVSDPAGYHAGIAGRELHWFDGNTQSWISQTDTGEWAGWLLPAETKLTLLDVRRSYFGPKEKVWWSRRVPPPGPIRLL